MNKTAFTLVECSDNDVIYEILVFNGNVSQKEIQDEIYKIKNKLYEEGLDEWQVQDVLDELSKKYDFETLVFNQLEI